MATEGTITRPTPTGIYNPSEENMKVSAAAFRRAGIGGKDITDEDVMAFLQSKYAPDVLKGYTDYKNKWDTSPAAQRGLAGKSSEDVFPIYLAMTGQAPGALQTNFVAFNASRNSSSEYYQQYLKAMGENQGRGATILTGTDSKKQQTILGGA